MKNAFEIRAISTMIRCAANSARKGAEVIGDVIQRVLMVPPQHFTVEYVINPWMGGVVNRELATQQWNALRAEIEAEGVEVLTLDQANGLPDMVFACNSGLVYRDHIYVSKYRNPQRRGEQPLFAEWFRKRGLRVVGDSYPEHFEGGGDAVFSDTKTLWAGYGFRSSKQAYEHIARELVGNFDIVPCELINENFYHLDTCFAPVGATSALWFPPALSAASQREANCRLPDAIEVTDVEARAFVCNSITIRRKVIAPRGISEATRLRLTQLGFSTVELDMSEFMKSGGACQCLVLKL